MLLLKTTFRNFTGKPSINLINLFGLSISLSLVIILSAYCYSELTTDRFHENGNDVYLLKKSPDAIYLPAILTETVRDRVPGLKSIVRMASSWEPPALQVENKDPIISSMVFADEDFFSLFTYKASEGDLLSALKDPMNVVITEALGAKLFGKEKALGKTILYNNRYMLKVTGVVFKQKKNTCLNFEAITSIETKKVLNGESGEFKEWGWNNFQTFLFLEKSAKPEDVIKNMVNLIPEEEQKYYSAASLVELRNIYFSKFSLFGSDHIVSGSRKKILSLLLVSLLVLIIALINFINISSSQWHERVKQTGINKILGASRTEIIRNILAESFIFFLAALIIAIQISVSLTPFLRNYTGINFNEDLIVSPGFIFISMGLIIVFSIAFSIVPALKISSSRAVDNLKKTVKNNLKNYSASGVLVTLQYSIAITLIAFTILVQKQVKFGSTNIGMNQENIIGIKLTEQLYGKQEVIKKSLAGIPLINEISFSQYYPGKIISIWGTQMKINGEKRDVQFNTFSADEVFFKMMGLELSTGRFYSDDLLSDKGKIIINEAFARKHNIADPLGASIIVGMMGMPASDAEIVGVVKDFHFKSLNTEIAPLAIRNDNQTSYCLAHVTTNDFILLKNTIEKIKETVSELSPSFPVEVSFFDSAVENMYTSEVRYRRAFSLLSACALLICSLGILAISLSVCRRRTKEIGIRKVNGSTIPEIILMLNRDFIKWVVLAFLISTPFAWYLTHSWLKNYAYKTVLSWWLFALSGVIALSISLITVSWQTWKAATRNPVEALRYE